MPSQCRISSVCCPSRGAGRRIRPGERESFTGVPIFLIVPATGWSSSTSISRALKGGEPCCRRPLSKDRLQGRGELPTVADTVGTAHKARVLGEILPPEDFAQPFPRGLIRRADTERPVLGVENLIGCVQSVGGSHRKRNLAGGEVDGRLPKGVGHGPL